MSMRMNTVRITRWRLATAWCVVLLLTGTVGGQQELKPLDASVADRGPLALSLRNISLDLRQPTTFDRVYRAPGGDGKLMRANGALYAVFPRSVYRRTRSGTVPVIPDGTVFYIGAPSFLTTASPAKPFG